MEKFVVETSDSPTVIIENVAGSVRVKGWDRPEVRADAEGPKSVQLEKENDTVTLRSDRGCIVRMPHESSLEIESVGGEANIKLVEGNITIGEVGGQLIMKSVGEIKAEQVNGQLVAKQIMGDLHITQVGGNASVRDVEGTVTLEEVRGNFAFRGIARGLNAETRGNASLRLDPDPEGTFEVAARGNISCRLDAGTSAEVILRSHAQSIAVKSPELSEKIHEEEFQFTLGDGKANVTLDARGNVHLVSDLGPEAYEGDFDFEFAEDIAGLADEITQQVSEQLEAQMESLSEHLSHITATVGASGSAKAQAAAQRAERKVAAAQRRLERKMAEARRRANRKLRKAAVKARHRRGGYSYSVSSAEEAGEPVTEEERRMVLEMVQEGNISVEDAETLLAALEGRTPESPGGEEEEKADEAAPGEE